MKKILLWGCMLFSSTLGAQNVFPDFEKTYEGNLGSKNQIVIRLKSEKGNLSGNYFISAACVQMLISGSIDPVGNFTISGTDERNRLHGTLTGKMSNSASHAEGSFLKSNEKKENAVSINEASSDYETLYNQYLSGIFSGYSGKYDDTQENPHFTVKQITLSYSSGKTFNYLIEIAADNGCVSTLNGSGTFTGPLSAVIVRGDCSMNLVFGNSTLFLTTVNCDHVNGLICSYDGDYIKVE